MKIIIPTHQEIEMIDPTWRVAKTIDLNQTEQFEPHIILTFNGQDYYHILPPQPYVDGTWDDPVRDAAIQAYLASIDLDA